MCFVDLQVFDRVLRRVIEWALRRKGRSEVLVTAVMSLYNGVRIRVRLGLAHL